MSKLTDHKSNKVSKVLYIGDSGAGKTGSLASLAKAGFKLRIIDLDAGLDVLHNLLKDSKSPYGPAAIENVEYETITELMRNVSGRLVPSQAKVWTRLVDMLINWSPKTTESWPWKKDKNDTAELGPVTTWDSESILVIDSLSRASSAALNFILAMNARLGQQPHQSDYFNAQPLVEGLLQMLYDENVHCNVIMIAHIAYIGEESGPVHGYPASIGKALPPKIGQYFNNTIMAKTTGSGTAQKRRILTNTSGVVELKNSAPLRVQAEYDLTTGLAEYFRAIRGEVDVGKELVIAKEGNMM